MEKPEDVIEVLRSGAEHARAVAADTMTEVHRRMGLGPATEPAKAKVE
jgi:hypothetical protein